MKQHDHDMIAEDRPAPEPFSEEIVIATRIIGESRIDFLCIDTGDEYDGFRYVTTRRADMAFGKGIQWMAPSPFDTALDAIEDALRYMPHLQGLNMSEIMEVCRDLDDQAVKCFAERAAQPVDAGQATCNVL